MKKTFFFLIHIKIPFYYTGFIFWSSIACDVLFYLNFILKQLYQKSGL